MITTRLLAAFAFTAFALPAVAAIPPAAGPRAPATAAATPVDPTRLTAARALIETIMPVNQRNAMLNSMTAGLLADMSRAVAANPQLQTMFANDPRARRIFDAFLQRQQVAAVAMVKQMMPGMAEAISRAYARRFSQAQLVELNTFFSTPTGRAYSAQSATVMTDPDVAAWQRQSMTGALKRIQADAKAMAAEIQALPARAPGS